MSKTAKINMVARGKLTVAEVNAGYQIIPGSAGKAVIIHDASLRAVGGNVGAVTTIDVQSTHATPVVACTFAQAQLTENTLLRVPVTGTAMGAGWNAELGSGAGVQLTKNGSNVTTATHLEYSVTYSKVTV